MDRKPLARPPRNENIKPNLPTKLVSTKLQSKLEEVKKPLRNSSAAINNRQKPLNGSKLQEETKDKATIKTGFTEKPSDRFKKVKAADPFTGGKKHKTNFGYIYSSGGVPLRINHGTVRNNIQWDTQPQDLDYDPLLINCFEGLLETDHPYALCAHKGSIELLQAPGAAEKTIPIVSKLIMPLRACFMSADMDIWNKGLEALKLLSQTVGHHLTGHIHILLAQLNKKMTTKQMREKILGVLNTIEEQGGKEALEVLRQKIPTYTSIYS